MAEGVQDSGTITREMIKLAHRVTDAAGSPWAFAVAFVLVIVWAFWGPFVNYSTAWQLIINTGTTILTFLMMFLLQHVQNRDTKAVHKKLDELILKLPQPSSDVAGIEKKID